MTRTPLQEDVEGAFFRVEGEGPSHVEKALPTTAAWHTLDAQDLARADDPVVEAVVTRFEEGVHWIRYRADAAPAGLLALRDLLRLDGPLAPWRAAKLGLDLATHLRSLHEAELWQLVVHPGRVALLPDRAALLPTLAGGLPPLSRAVPGPPEGWVHFVAPEVLRTRGQRADLLAAGDVLALGRTLEALCALSSSAQGEVDAFEVTRRRVEAADPDPFGTFAPAFSGLASLVRAMCAPKPADRPTLVEVVSRLEDARKKAEPAATFEALRRGGSLDAARRCWQDLQEAHEQGVFGVLERDVLLMGADVALLEVPPACARAVRDLERAESPRFYEADVQVRLGRAYAAWTGSAAEEHRRQSKAAYARAARASEWDAAVVEEWAAALSGAEDAAAALAACEDVPFAKRPKALARFRSRLLVATGSALAAWEELARSFPGKPFDAELYALADGVAGEIAASDLVAWLARNATEAGLDAPRSIAWRRAGNAEKAQELLARAKERRP